MSVFLDQAGSSADAFSDCLTISRGDGNLGDQPVMGDTSVIELTYDGGAPAPATAARLHALVHNNFGGPIVLQDIVVTALSGGIDPYSGMDVTGNGFTYTDSSTGTTVIRVVYDFNNCNGGGIFVFDTGGNQISLARAPLVYHELSHAFRAATGTNLPNDEPPAETDENVMRAELGYCLRDVNNHGGGCGHGDDCSGPPTPDSGGCFIVSATTGSPRSAEVARLRALRDRVAGASGLGCQLIDAIYSEYYTFSPAIAKELKRAKLAKQATLSVVVQPLLAWYGLAGTLAFDYADDECVRRAAADLASACPRYLGRESIGRHLHALRNANPIPQNAPKMLKDFATQIEMASRLPFASWAILDALIYAWSPATHHDPRSAVAEWLASAPVEKLALPKDLEQFGVQLSALARLLDFKPAARHQLGNRLAQARPDAVLQLKDHDFVSQGGSR